MEPLLQCAPWPAVHVALLAAAAVEDMRPAIDGYLEGILSSEWPENFSLLTYADLCAYLGVPNRHLRQGSLSLSDLTSWVLLLVPLASWTWCDYFAG
jgi:hypothetical protein